MRTTCGVSPPIRVNFLSAQVVIHRRRPRLAATTLPAHRWRLRGGLEAIANAIRIIPTMAARRSGFAPPFKGNEPRTFIQAQELLRRCEVEPLRATGLCRSNIVWFQLRFGDLPRPQCARTLFWSKAFHHPSGCSVDRKPLEG